MHKIISLLLLFLSLSSFAGTITDGRQVFTSKCYDDYTCEVLYISDLAEEQSPYVNWHTTFEYKELFEENTCRRLTAGTIAEFKHSRSVTTFLKEFEITGGNHFQKICGLTIIGGVAIIGWAHLKITDLLAGRNIPREIKNGLEILILGDSNEELEISREAFDAIMWQFIEINRK
jgi:hypothetical protein